MPIADRPLRELQTAPVATVTADDDLESCERKLAEHKITCLVVLGRDGRAAGVLSQTDLLRAGHALARTTGSPYLLKLPSMCAGDLMTPTVLTAAADGSALDAARVMVERKVLRLFVLDEGRPVGVLSARDLLRVVIDSRIESPLGQAAVTGTRTLDVSEPLNRATELLVKARLSGVVLTENEVPVGVFTQPEAVAARDQPPETPVGEWASYSFVCMHSKTPLWRAACVAATTRARRVVTIENNSVHGVLGGLQFVAALLEAARNPTAASDEREGSSR